MVEYVLSKMLEKKKKKKKKKKEKDYTPGGTRTHNL